MKKSLFLFLLIASTWQLSSCTKNKDTTPAATVVWSKTVTMSAKFELPAPAGRSETATADLQILSDNTLTYNIVVSGLSSSDALTAAHIHRGDAGTNGGVYIPFTGISGSTVKGSVVLTSAQADSLKNYPAYVNVHSTQVPGGLARGQIDSKVVFAQDVVMVGANENPAVNTTATGLALLRLTEDKKLYSKITVSNLEATDVLTAAHIHTGAAGTNGPVIIGFYGSAAEFGTLKINILDNILYNNVLNDAVYVNAHSTAHASGLVRGQIR
ncbi:MAG: hypothetical protein JWN76_3668 [Chitinophagaceae bacterium]|nr:hypothetical protein [Chitinophagaceae bacterium]